VFEKLRARRAKLKLWQTLCRDLCHVSGLLTRRTCLRASELRGLAWSDVDLKEGVLAVRQRADLYCTIGSPKSASSRREVPLMPIVVNTLREWKLACPKSDLDLVFPTGNGATRPGRQGPCSFFQVQRCRCQA